MTTFCARKVLDHGLLVCRWNDHSNVELSLPLDSKFDTSRENAPWEARTPDLEVNGLTLWPTELRKPANTDSFNPSELLFCQSKNKMSMKNNAETRDRTGDLQIFGLTLSQLSYRGLDVQGLYLIVKA